MEHFNFNQQSLLDEYSALNLEIQGLYQLY